MAYIFIISRMILRLKNFRARSESTVLWSTSVRPRDGVSPENGLQLPVISGKLFMLNWLVPAWVSSRNKKQQLSTMLFGGSFVDSIGY